MNRHISREGRVSYSSSLALPQPLLPRHRVPVWPDFHSQLSGKYLVWVGVFGRRQDVLGRFSERISEFPWSQELPGQEESVLSWKRRILGVNGVWDCSYMKICSCLAQSQWTATSKHFLLFLARFLGTGLQLWKDENNFSPVIDVSSFLFVSLPQRPESVCACPISGAEKCVLKRSSRCPGKGTPFAVIWLQTSNTRKLKGHIWVEGLVLKLFTDFRNQSGLEWLERNRSLTDAQLLNARKTRGKQLPP